MVDAHFGVPRLAGIYDALDPDRRDLDAYVALAAELGAATVADLGCGTGTLAVLLAGRGILVTGIDPAAASIDVARGKPGAEAVTWVVGDAGALRGRRADLVTMTGNVAQVFLSDAGWAAALDAARAALRPGGHLVFETRVPARQAWVGWTRERSRRVVDVPGVGAVETWIDLGEVAPPLVSFRTTFRFHADGEVLTSESTLRFRERDELAASLEAAGFEVRSVSDAPDRPGLEWVFVAARR